MQVSLGMEAEITMLNTAYIQGSKTHATKKKNRTIYAAW